MHSNPDTVFMAQALAQARAAAFVAGGRFRLRGEGAHAHGAAFVHQRRVTQLLAVALAHLLLLGQVAEFRATGQLVVRSQDALHPFYMSAHMTGAAQFDPEQQNPPTGSADGRGDAEFVNIVPPAEYLDKYVFFTDPTYSETNLVLVRAKGPDGFADVNLDCLGVVDGWQPLGAAGKYQYTRVDLVRQNFQPQGNCNNGRHEISSKQPFGLTVWGWGSAATGSFNTQYVSYAYPGGAGVAPINTVEVPTVPE